MPLNNKQKSYFPVPTREDQVPELVNVTRSFEQLSNLARSEAMYNVSAHKQAPTMAWTAFYHMI